ncbi:MAG: hypothetical protein PUP91_12720 [Rhizonema sp. PD37]|nr:hypothetical protein [Rhizonema sp. PD37]
MENQIGFVLKVFLFSALISFLIKYTGPNLSISATATNALIIILLPTIVLGSVLLYKKLNDNSAH